MFNEFTFDCQNCEKVETELFHLKQENLSLQEVNSKLANEMQDFSGLIKSYLQIKSEKEALELELSELKDKVDSNTNNITTNDNNNTNINSKTNINKKNASSSNKDEEQEELKYLRYELNLAKKKLNNNNDSINNLKLLNTQLIAKNNSLQEEVLVLNSSGDKNKSLEKMVEDKNKKIASLNDRVAELVKEIGELKFKNFKSSGGFANNNDDTSNNDNNYNNGGSNNADYNHQITNDDDNNIFEDNYMDYGNNNNNYNNYNNNDIDNTNSMKSNYYRYNEDNLIKIENEIRLKEEQQNIYSRNNKDDRMLITSITTNNKLKRDKERESKYINNTILGRKRGNPNINTNTNTNANNNSYYNSNTGNELYSLVNENRDLKYKNNLYKEKYIKFKSKYNSVNEILNSLIKSNAFNHDKRGSYNNANYYDMHANDYNNPLNYDRNANYRNAYRSSFSFGNNAYLGNNYQMNEVKNTNLAKVKEDAFNNNDNKQIGKEENYYDKDHLFNKESGCYDNQMEIEVENTENKDDSNDIDKNKESDNSKINNDTSIEINKEKDNYEKLKQKINNAEDKNNPLQNQRELSYNEKIRSAKIRIEREEKENRIKEYKQRFSKKSVSKAKESKDNKEVNDKDNEENKNNKDNSDKMTKDNNLTIEPKVSKSISKYIPPSTIKNNDINKTNNTLKVVISQEQSLVTIIEKILNNDKENKEGKENILSLKQLKLTPYEIIKQIIKAISSTIANNNFNNNIHLYTNILHLLNTLIEVQSNNNLVVINYIIDNYDILIKDFTKKINELILNEDSLLKVGSTKTEINNTENTTSSMILNYYFIKNNEKNDNDDKDNDDEDLLDMNRKDFYTVSFINILSFITTICITDKNSNSNVKTSYNFICNKLFYFLKETNYSCFNLIFIKEINDKLKMNNVDLKEEMKEDDDHKSKDNTSKEIQPEIATTAKIPKTSTYQISSILKSSIGLFNNEDDENEDKNKTEAIKKTKEKDSKESKDISKKSKLFTYSSLPNLISNHSKSMFINLIESTRNPILVEIKSTNQDNNNNSVLSNLLKEQLKNLRSKVEESEESTDTTSSFDNSNIVNFNFSNILIIEIHQLLSIINKLLPVEMTKAIILEILFPEITSSKDKSVYRLLIFYYIVELFMFIITKEKEIKEDLGKINSLETSSNKPTTTIFDSISLLKSELTNSSSVITTLANWLYNIYWNQNELILKRFSEYDRLLCFVACISYFDDDSILKFNVIEEILTKVKEGLSNLNITAAVKKRGRKSNSTAGNKNINDGCFNLNDFDNCCIGRTALGKIINKLNNFKTNAKNNLISNNTNINGFGFNNINMLNQLNRINVNRFNSIGVINNTNISNVTSNTNITNINNIGNSDVSNTSNSNSFSKYNRNNNNKSNTGITSISSNNVNINNNETGYSNEVYLSFLTGNSNSKSHSNSSNSNKFNNNNKSEEKMNSVNTNSNNSNKIIPSANTESIDYNSNDVSSFFNTNTNVSTRSQRKRNK